jgi:nitroreductase
MQHAIQALKRMLPAPIAIGLRRTKRWGMALRKRQIARRLGRQDLQRFTSAAFTTRVAPSRENLEALMLMSSHSLEKGMSLAEPRPLFGMPTVRQLMTVTEDYARQFKADWVVACAVSTLRAYLDFHSSVSDPQLVALVEWLDKHTAWNMKIDAGILPVDGAALRRSGGIADEFFATRYSVRHFSARKVDRYLLEKAFDHAMKSPSVCNRQSARVKCIRNPDMIRQIQNIAGGARGFGEQADTLLIITCDLACFHGWSERNQGWVDGGIYAMSLLYALHAQGLASCCLNCCLKPNEECEIRELLNIPDSEILIARIAVGHYPEHLNVARSPRRPPGSVVAWYESVESAETRHENCSAEN